MSTSRDLSMKTIILILLGMQSIAVEGLVNTVAVVGSEVNLKCPSVSGNCYDAEWYKYNGLTPIRFFRYNVVLSSVDRDRYSVTGSSGCELHIRNVQLTDAGRLSCVYIDSENRQTSKTAFLIILESLPRCSVNVTDGDVAEGDGVQLTCEMKFNGTYNASMTWKDLENVPTSVENGRNVKLSHSVVAKLPEIPSYECIATFELPIVPGVDGLASNIPTAPSCKTNTAALLYSVRNVTLSPSLPVYSIGSTVVCSSHGNPSPTYKWQSADSFINVTDGDWKDICGETRKELNVKNPSNSAFRCVASNTVRGSSITAYSQSFQVNFEDSTAEKSMTSISREIGIGFFVGVVCTLLLGIVVVLLMKHMRYIQFHRNPTHNASTADSGKLNYENVKSTQRKPSRVEASTSDPVRVVDEKAYASLGDERNELRVYASLGAERK